MSTTYQSTESEVQAPLPDREPQIREKQIAKLFEQTPVSQVGVIVGASLIAVACLPFAKPFSLGLWVLSVASFVTLRFALWFAYRRDQGARSISQWYALYLGLLGLSALIWPLVIGTVIPPENYLLAGFVGVVVCGNAAAGMLVLAYRVEAMLVFSVPALLLSAVALILREHLVTKGFGAAILALLIFLILVSRRMYRTLRESLALEMEREVLIASLSAENLRRSESEQQLIESRDYLEELLNNGAELVQSTDASGNIVYANRKWLETFAYAEEDIAKLNLMALVHPDSHQHCADMFAQIARGESVEHIEADFLSAVGERVSLVGTCSSQFDENGAVTGTRAILRDITEIRNTQKALQKHEQRYKNIVEYANDLIFETDQDGYFIYLNDAAERLSGLPQAGLIGRHYSELIDEDYREKANELFTAQTLARESNSYIEYPSKISNEHQIWFAQNTQIIFEDDRVIGYQAIARDITENIEASRLRNEALETSRANQLQQENFISMISHEIRTPLTAVIGFSSLIDPSRLAQEDQMHFESMQLATRRVLNIANDLLDFKKLESGRIEFRETAFDIRELVERVARSFFPLVNAKHLKIDWQVEDEVPPVLIGDPDRLDQVLQNLVSNAVKYTDVGAIDIAVTLPDSLGSDSVTLEFAVSDTGRGISEADRERLFHGYQKVEDRTGFNLGSGLGVSIFKNLVENQGGKVAVDSELDKGSTFKFQLSFAVGDAQDLNTTPATVSGRIRETSPRILVVDDNEVNLYLAKQYISRWDKNSVAVTATSGPEAIEKFATQDFDIVLMDVQMPKMDGYEATALLRRQSKKSVPIVAVTGAVQAAEREKSSEFDDVLLKPYIKEQLEAVLEKFMGRAASTAEVVTSNEDVAAAQTDSSEDNFKHVDYASLQLASDDDPKVMSDIIGMYEATYAEYNEKLESLTAASAWPDLAAQAHKQKTVALYAGLDAVGEALSMLEGKDGKGLSDETIKRRLVRQICIARREALAELRTIKARLPVNPEATIN